MQPIDLPFVVELYRRYADDLAAVITQQREFLAAHRAVTPQLDDVEAEITYLLVRELRPATVMELGTFHGWSTTWLLRALRDNGAGHLHSFDRLDGVLANVPDDLSAGRWTFVHGDVTDRLARVPPDVDHLFVDADHGRRFGLWYLEHLFPRVAAGTPVTVHDVLHGRRARVWSEGRVVVSWLRRHDVGWFSASRRAAPDAYDHLVALRAELGLTGARGSTANPMIFFRMP